MEKKIADKLLSQIKNGTLKITYWDGEVKSYGRGEPKAQVILKDKKVFRKLLSGPSIALGEAYMNGLIDVADPFENLLKVLEKNQINLPVAKLGRFKRGVPYKNKTKHQQSFIEHHYDVGNDFYRLWLDKETMNYTCAYFKTRRDSLAQAQIQKVDHVLAKLQIQKGQSLLDIGCGWGYLLMRAAEKYGATGLGVTLSAEQHAYAVAESKRRGLDKQIKFERANYQDMLNQNKQFDRVVSVGILEHIGQGNHRKYFEVVDHCLKKSGISVLHSITHQDEVPGDAWIVKYIFPGGYIPSVREITALMPDYNFYLYDYENIGQHYAMTLEHWWKNFEKHKKQIIDRFDERFYRMWRLYLIVSMMAFKTGSSHLSQWTFKKGSEPTWPLTRERLYKK